MRAFLISAAAALALLLGAPVEQAAAGDGVVASLQEQAQPSREGGGRVNIDVDVDRDERPWYLSPYWIGIGVVALALIVILSLVSRSGGGGTTIVKT